jgi:hypothetical protein
MVDIFLSVVMFAQDPENILGPPLIERTKFVIYIFFFFEERFPPLYYIIKQNQFIA